MIRVIINEKCDWHFSSGELGLPFLGQKGKNLDFCKEFRMLMGI